MRDKRDEGRSDSLFDHRSRNVGALVSSSSVPSWALRPTARLWVTTTEVFVAINADVAAVPDMDMLARCVREGFDAVIALGDVS